MFNQNQVQFLESLENWEAMFRGNPETGLTDVTLQPTFPMQADLPLEFSVVDFDELCARVSDFAHNFDADYETYIWLGPDGHGQNGAPYHIRDILDEMESYDDELRRLWLAFDEYQRLSENLN